MTFISLEKSQRVSWPEKSVEGSVFQYRALKIAKIGIKKSLSEFFCSVDFVQQREEDYLMKSYRISEKGNAEYFL